MRTDITVLFTLTTALLLQACGSPEAEVPKADAAPDSTSVAPAQNGPQVIHMQDGGRMEGELVNGQRTGAWASYFPNGGIRSKANYSQGVEVGPTEVFHENGMTYYTGQYNDGTPVGEWIFYDPAGKETQRVVYDAEGNKLQ